MAETVMDLPSAGSFPICLPQPGVGQAKARSPGIVQMSHTGTQVLEISPVAPKPHINRKLEAEDGAGH